LVATHTLLLLLLLLGCIPWLLLCTAAAQLLQQQLPALRLHRLEQRRRDAQPQPQPVQ
jgi:hypothetical protein